MTPDDLDRILSAEDLIEPSSGFAMNVMDAVRAQAAEPPPRRFPWTRFATGLAGCGVMAMTGTILLSRFDATLSGIAPELAYATAALLVSLGLLSLPRLLGRY
jgi:hypothetical protein